MPWTSNDYPDSLANFNAPVRDKAIEIANTLVEDQGYDEGKAIAIATTQAKQWAARRDIPLGEGEGDQGPSEAKPVEVHVIPTDDGWGLRNVDTDEVALSFETQAEAILAARREAKSANTDVVIHAPNGQIRGHISLRELDRGPTYHVSPRDEAWVVARDDADQASGVFERKTEAVDAAREMAGRRNGVLLIHGRDCSIQEVLTYSRSPARH